MRCTKCGNCYIHANSITKYLGVCGYCRYGYDMPPRNIKTRTKTMPYSPMLSSAEVRAKFPKALKILQGVV